jgi:hypothetical protein
MQTLPQPTERTAADALDAYLEAFRRRVDAGVRSPATLTMHAQHRDMILAVLPPGVRLEDVDVEHVALGNVSGSTKRKRMSTLFGALRLAHRRGELAELPVRPEIDHVYKPGQAHLQTFVDSAELDSMEDAGAARRPPRKVSRKRVGNPTPPEFSDGSGGGAAANSSAPEQRPRGTSRARQSDRTSTSEPSLRADASVPRDRVELSTHGFSVGEATLEVSDGPSRAGPPPGQGEGPCTTQLQPPTPP